MKVFSAQLTFKRSFGSEGHWERVSHREDNKQSLHDLLQDLVILQGMILFYGLMTNKYTSSVSASLSFDIGCFALVQSPLISATELCFKHAIRFLTATE